MLGHAVTPDRRPNRNEQNKPNANLGHDQLNQSREYYNRRMSMGKRHRDRQPAMWVETTDLPTAASHPFYQRLNRLLREHGCDDFAETQCATFYADTMGRPGLPPSIYFRLLLIGYFEGIDSERGIAWRAADSLALRDFLGLDLREPPPDHSTIRARAG
jgi:transposase